MSHKSVSSTISTIGIDIGKNSFHLVGLDQRGAIVLQVKCSRAQLERRLANIPSCLIGEACSGAHCIGRQLAALGHDVRLIPAQYVKPFLKGHKNDYRDAEAIAEAVQRPTMHFVAIKQMDLLALHRVADIIVVTTRALNMGGFADAAHLLVGSALPENVDTVVIDGRILKRAGKLTALPEAQVVADARAALEGIRKRANWR
jgi:hypothetical protein